MSVNYSTVLKTDRMQLVVDRLASKVPAAATGTPLAGQLVIGTSALSGAVGVLATIPLNPTPGVAAGAVLTLSGTPLTALGSAPGTAAKAELRNNAGTTIIGGLTVGVSGADIIISSTTVSVGQPVTVTSGTITHG
jgi:hypothetical protein